MWWLIIPAVIWLLCGAAAVLVLAEEKRREFGSPPRNHPVSRDYRYAQRWMFGLGPIGLAIVIRPIFNPDAS